MKIQHRTRAAECGQALLETVIVVPLFVVSLGAFLTLAVAYGWRESTANTATSLSLAVPPRESPLTADTERLQTLLEIRNKASTQGPSINGQPSRQALLTAEQRTKPSCTNSRPKPSNQGGHLNFCFQGDSTVYAKPHPSAPLTRYAPLLQHLTRHGNPLMTGDITPIFDNVAGFRHHQRNNWHKGIMSRLRLRPHNQEFRRRVAQGGRTRDSGPYNLTRDCLFSAQGKICLGTAARRNGALNKLFRQQRSVSYSVQLGLCTAESCGRAPHPAVCGALLAAAVAQSSAGQPPSSCPVTVAGARAHHTFATSALKLREFAETLEYSRDLGDSLLVDSAQPMY